MLDAPMLAVLASPRRQEILRLVWNEERSAGDIHRSMPDVTFGAVSLQLRALAEAGLVKCRVESRHRYYRARRAALGKVGAMLEQMWTDALWRLKLQAELDSTRRGPRALPYRAQDARRGPRALPHRAQDARRGPRAASHRAENARRRRRSPAQGKVRAS